MLCPLLTQDLPTSSSIARGWLPALRDFLSQLASILGLKLVKEDVREKYFLSELLTLKESKLVKKRKKNVDMNGNVILLKTTGLVTWLPPLG